MRLLDLFCGAGGAARGYVQAGFEVVGVDIKAQPRYPYEFIQADVLEFMARLIDGVGGTDGFDIIHASPPCQAYSTQTANPGKHPDLIGKVRKLIRDQHYVIENVEGAKGLLKNPVRLCGSSFGLDVRRHRYFESSLPIKGLPCEHAWQKPRFQSLDRSMVLDNRLACVVGVHGHINYPGEFALRCKAMGIDWMTNEELVQSIPPAYTNYIGRQLIRILGGS